MSGYTVLFSILFFGPFALISRGVRQKIFGDNNATGGVQ